MVFFLVLCGLGCNVGRWNADMAGRVLETLARQAPLVHGTDHGIDYRPALREVTTASASGSESAIAFMPPMSSV